MMTYNHVVPNTGVAQQSRSETLIFYKIQIASVVLDTGEAKIDYFVFPMMGFL